MSLSNYLETELLDHIRGSAWSAPGTIYIQLFVSTGPDEDGNPNGNAATENTFKTVTFSAASGNSMVTSADLTWTSVAGSETYTYFALWDGNTGYGTDNCLGIGSITANAVTAGDTFTISAGDLSFSLE